MTSVRTYLILLLILLSVSCKKEYSSEGSLVPENSWEFTESQQMFGGPVDSSFLMSSADGESLTIFGTSADDHNNQFYLKITAADIRPGTFSGSEVQLRYLGIGSSLADDVAGVIIIIEEIDDNNISGTFSGVIRDSLNQMHTITGGKFHCSAQQQSNIPGENKLTVWTKELCSTNNSIEIRINNTSRFITSASAGQPSCGATGAAAFSLESGNYNVEVICGSDTLNYQVNVNEECSYLEVQLSQDYLPLGKTSYWEYSDVHDQGVTQIFTAESDENINGNIYTKLSSNTGVDYYFRKQPHIYFQFRELSFQDFVSDPPSVELVILKDNLMKGQKWETPPLDVDISGVVQKIKLVSTIVNRDYSDVINGVEYHNLIKVNTELFFSPDNGNSYAISGSAYNTVFARGKGIVSYNDMDVAIEWGIRNIFLSP